MKCPGCQIDFTPNKTWRSKSPDRRLITYGVMPDHKPVSFNSWGQNTVSSDAAPCDWVGHVLPLEEAEAKRIAQ